MGSGIHVDSWAKVEGHCEIECEVVGDEAQFRLGSVCGGGLDLIFTEEALKIMTEKCSDALRQVSLLYDEERNDD